MCSWQDIYQAPRADPGLHSAALDFDRPGPIDFTFQSKSQKSAPPLLRLWIGWLNNTPNICSVVPPKLRQTPSGCRCRFLLKPFSSSPDGCMAPHLPQRGGLLVNWATRQPEANVSSFAALSSLGSGDFAGGEKQDRGPALMCA